MASADYLSRTDCDSIVGRLDLFGIDPRVKATKAITYTGKDGRPHKRHFSGAYCDVFKVDSPTDDGKDRKLRALRLPIKDAGHARERYPEISRFFDHLERRAQFSKKNVPARFLPDLQYAAVEDPGRRVLDYFVGCEYIERAVQYQNKVHEASWIDWIPGVTLPQYIQECRTSPAKLATLASSFKEMVRFLHLWKIAHGDLQPGNILVVAAGNGEPQLKLVDYDGLVVPFMSEDILDRTFIGVEDFQPPAPRKKAILEKADYFSELVIYLSLLQYSRNPGLWLGVKEQDQRLLFEAADFKSPSRSPVFAKLRNSTDPEVRMLSATLADYCSRDPATFEALEAISPSVAPSQTDIFEQVFGSHGRMGQGSPQSKSQASQEVPVYCQNRHGRMNSGDIYCPIDNDLRYFFGPSRTCPTCHRIIPDDPRVKWCPWAGHPV